MRAAVALLLTIGSFATPAMAQRSLETETGSRLGIPTRARIPDAVMSEADRGRVTMLQFARCTFDRFPKQTAAVLRMPLGPQYSKAMANIADSECLASGEVRFKPIILRGALFTELWRRRVIAEADKRPWAPVFGSFDPASVTANDDDDMKQYAALMAFADCVTMRDRNAASDVLTLPTASKAQNAAYARLQPNLGPCIDNGVSLKFSKIVLEGVLAESLYRSPAIDAASAAPSAVAGKR